MFVNCNNLDNSIGSYPDSLRTFFLFESSNTICYQQSLLLFIPDTFQPPSISIPSGFYSFPVNVNITNPNSGPTTIHYTLNGNDPTTNSPIYHGIPNSYKLFKGFKSKGICR